jgi:hypothetical protein
MLAITADGQKLLPYMVFKCKTIAKEKFPQGSIVRVQESGSMTEDLVDDWIKSVWFRRQGSLLRQWSILVLDSFRGQTTENVKAQLRPEKFDLVIIPGGMTEMLQPLNVVINQPFKAHIQCSYSEWAQKTDDASRSP